MWCSFFFDVETRNYRNFYTAKRNNKRALVNLQGKVGLFDIDTWEQSSVSIIYQYSEREIVTRCAFLQRDNFKRKEQISTWHVWEKEKKQHSFVIG